LSEYIKMLNKIDIEIQETAEKSVIQELNNQEIDYRTLLDDDFTELVQNRINKIKINVKKVGLTTAIAIALTVVTGGI
jgi:cell fate regulator YaaT (PSP1 superfamily)